MTKNTPTAPLDPLPADAAKIVAFPQHAIKAAKRPVTIESIIEGAAGMASKQLIALVSAAFPNATVGEVRDALKAYSADRLVERKRLLAEEHLDLRLFDLCELGHVLIKGIHKTPVM